VNRYAIALVWPTFTSIALIIMVLFYLAVYSQTSAPGGQLDFVPASVVFATSALLLVIAIAIILSALYVYKHNYILVTNKHLIKVQQTGLFARQTAELGLGNIEDVKGGRAGVLGTILDYGDIEIQTAGTSENFIFRTVHRPQLVADRLLQYKEEYRHAHPEFHNHD
ncbi:MAG TPA: PH domain-containing protein, partial [Candidatus Saccharimonadia bacterium]|nr:PH domain-containing protein [Candidatus Saccharimonadia bacterium]